MQIQEMIDHLRSQWYIVKKSQKRESSLRDIREKKKWEKPKWNTFQSRYKRRGNIIDDFEELIECCFNKPVIPNPWNKYWNLWYDRMINS
jgi:hypothetical protein